MRRRLFLLIATAAGVGVLAFLIWGRAPDAAGRADARPCPQQATVVRIELGDRVTTAQVCGDQAVSREEMNGRTVRLRLPGGLLITVEPGPPYQVVLRLGHEPDLPAQPPAGKPDAGPQPDPGPPAGDGGKAESSGTGPGAGAPTDGGVTEVTNIAVDLRPGAAATATDQGCRSYENLHTGEITIGRMTINCP